MKRLEPVWVLLILFLVPALAAQEETEVVETGTSCTICHSDPDMMDNEEWLGITDAFESSDVHGEVGLSCHDCHGGNPDPALADDMLSAMDESYAEKPFRARPDRAEIPLFCGICHSDPIFMKRYRPDARIDQEERYWTSHHGQALERGDSNVATCVDCHGVHGIRRAADPESGVYPTRVAETCGRCHSDPQRMASYTLPDGRPLPVDQVERWKSSVHGHALLDKEDLFAPTCNDCHGNHGATPPGHEDVSLVCGQCHGREARLFRASTKHAGFTDHDAMVAEAEKGCADCHEPPEPQVAIEKGKSFKECVTCHGNHSVAKPTVAALGSLPGTPCSLCHEGPGLIDRAYREQQRIQHNYQEMKQRLLAMASSEGIEGEDLFDWLIDQALDLETHTVTGSGGEKLLRPEFARLFEKFRIGKIHYEFTDPRTGEKVRERLVRCGDCHSPEPVLADEPVGFKTTTTYLERMHELMVLSARAERSLLAARRGGVEVREVLTELDHAVDRQIDLEVLVHGFTAAEDSEYLKKHEEGMEHARKALEGAEAALGELEFRHTGLRISLVFILLVLIALGLKIRSLPPS